MREEIVREKDWPEVKALYDGQKIAQEEIESFIIIPEWVIEAIKSGRIK